MKYDGSEYYEYVFLYTDSALVLSENGKYLLREQIGKHFYLKEESIGPLKIYLGGILFKVEVEKDVREWEFGSAQYVRADVENV